MELLYGLLGILGLGAVAALLGAVALDSRPREVSRPESELDNGADTLTVTRQVVAEMTGVDVTSAMLSAPIETVLTHPDDHHSPAEQMRPGEWFAKQLSRCSQELGTGRRTENVAIGCNS